MKKRVWIDVFYNFGESCEILKGDYDNRSERAYGYCFLIRMATLIVPLIFLIVIRSPFNIFTPKALKYKGFFYLFLFAINSMILPLVIHSFLKIIDFVQYLNSFLPNKLSGKNKGKQQSINFYILTLNEQRAWEDFKQAEGKKNDSFANKSLIDCFITTSKYNIRQALPSFLLLFGCAGTLNGCCCSWASVFNYNTNNNTENL